MRIQSTFLGMIALAFAIPATAVGEPAAGVRVQYKDLNLATTAGRDELERRLDRAARSVCGIDDARTGTRLPSDAARRCLRDARTRLDAQFATLVGGEPQGG